ncbi:MAG: hypothetical protein KJN70_03025 [Eudoraea sp.]|nr:hypothetical protein [Eudoraea sp.]
MRGGGHTYIFLYQFVGISPSTIGLKLQLVDDSCYDNNHASFLTDPAGFNKTRIVKHFNRYIKACIHPQETGIPDIIAIS